MKSDLRALSSTPADNHTKLPKVTLRVSSALLARKLTSPPMAGGRDTHVTMFYLRPTVSVLHLRRLASRLQSPVGGLRAESLECD
jgi:hypothetical protein